jgi:hypothetical protein
LIVFHVWPDHGEMPERPKGHDWKSCIPLITGSRVRRPQGGGRSEATEHIPLSRREPIREGADKTGFNDWAARSRRDAREAEGARLEIVYSANNGIEGSNPSLSAMNIVM